MAKRLASIRSGELEPPPPAVQTAKRDIIGRCIYGVDINPMAAELCKVSLWIEALDPGKPLSFLDHHIQVGNSLLGTTPRLMAAGIPDDAFKPIEGDDKKYASELRKQNKTQRKQRDAGVRQLGLEQAPAADYGYLSDSMQLLASAPDDSLDDVRQKEAFYAELAQDDEYIKARLLADAWCAAFVWAKRQDTDLPLTDLLYRHLERNPQAENLQAIRKEVIALTDRYGFFHWHVAFPDVFQVPDDLERTDPRVDTGGYNEGAGWNGGFDVVLGNPPWEHTEIKEKEWFAERDHEIAAAPGARRKQLIAALNDTNKPLFDEFKAEKRTADGFSHFVRTSGNYPLTGRGRINTYPLFAEKKRSIINGRGRVGTIVPSGIATDDTTKFFFQDLMRTHSLGSMYDFENRQGLFPAVDSRMKFSLLTMTGSEIRSHESEFVFFALNVGDLDDKWRRFKLSSADIAMLNPNTGTMPTFRSQRDAEITKEIYSRVPVLIKETPLENPWGITFKQGLFNMTSDSDKFRTREQLESRGFALEGNHFVGGGKRYLPLYEAKMFDAYNHRFAEVVLSATAVVRQGQARHFLATELACENAVPIPRYWVNARDVDARLDFWEREWLFGFRDVTSTTNERTAVFAVLPRVAVGHTAPLSFTFEDVNKILASLSNFMSFGFDYVARQKIGGIHLTYGYLKQLPVIPPHTYTKPLLDFIKPRVLELSYTAWDLQAFARDLDYEGAPFVWDEERRFLMRRELDALYFHLYGIKRDDVDYIMDTFPIVKRKDEAAHGEYRTKRVILEMVNQMAGLPTMLVPAPKAEHGEITVPDVSHWVTPLDPPPADPRAAHEVE